jgi:uncharacterized glyoxalase superfamily protein PhnB
VTAIATIEFVTIEVADTTAANRFYAAAFGLGTRTRLRASEAPTTGVRGFTLSLAVSQPATIDGVVGAALDAGATSLKPPAKSLWGYGGVVQSPDGTIWTVASSAKKDTGRYGRRYVEFDTDPIKLTRLKRRALAKVAGVSAAGTGSHRLTVGSDAGPFTDPDGFVCEAASLNSRFDPTLGLAIAGS